MGLTDIKAVGLQCCKIVSGVIRRLLCYTINIQSRPRRRVRRPEHELEKHDIDWGRILELQLVAHPKEAHPEVVALD
jgi:hypothetical protein